MPAAAPRFRPAYLLIAAAIFAIEVFIARRVPGGTFVRDSLGDILVIALIHFGLRGATRWPLLACAAGSTLFGFAVEGLQYLHLADRLGLRPGSALYVIIGNTFSVSDLAMYLLGGAGAAGLDAGLVAARRRA